LAKRTIDWSAQNSNVIGMQTQIRFKDGINEEIMFVKMMKLQQTLVRIDGLIFDLMVTIVAEATANDNKQQKRWKQWNSSFIRRPSSRFSVRLNCADPVASNWWVIGDHTRIDRRTVCLTIEENKIIYEIIYGDWLILIALTGSFVNDVLVVIVSQTATQLFVIHFRLILTNSPSSSHFVRIDQLELPSVAGPGDAALTRFVGQQFEQKLPQLNRAGTWKEKGAEVSLWSQWPWWTMNLPARAAAWITGRPASASQADGTVCRRPAADWYMLPYMDPFVVFGMQADWANMGDGCGIRSDCCGA
jgi:hypothetical protein